MYSMHSIQDGMRNNKENINKFIEEADLNIIPHIEDSIQSKNIRIILLSNDADVLVLVLYFMQYSLLLVWKNYGYDLEPGKVKDSSTK